MLTPTRAFAVPGLVRHNLGGLLNRASYNLVGLLTRPYSSLIRSWRGDSLALAPRGSFPRGSQDALLLQPQPGAYTGGLAIGHCRDRLLAARPSRCRPVDPALDGFVAAGAPPIYVGFGSSVGPDPASLGAAVSEAVHRAGVRAVIAERLGSNEQPGGATDTLVVESAPHRWLFTWVRWLLSITAEPERPPPVWLQPVPPSSAPSKAIGTGARCAPSRYRDAAVASQQAHPANLASAIRAAIHARLRDASSRRRVVGADHSRKTAPHGHQRRSRAP